LNIVKANKKRYSDVFSILGISHCKEYRLGEHRWGELAGAVGYQQVIYSSCPVGWKK